MDPYLIDSHSHLQFSGFDNDRQEVIRMVDRIRANSIETFEEASTLSTKHGI